MKTYGFKEGDVIIRKKNYQVLENYHHPMKIINFYQAINLDFVNLQDRNGKVKPYSTKYLTLCEEVKR